MLGQERDILAALAQGRDGDGHDVEAVIEVLAEGALLEGGRGGPGWWPATMRTSMWRVLFAAQALELALLEDAQQFHLNVARHVAISSRKAVPVSASSNLPGLVELAR